MMTANNDSDDLEALFDSIAADCSTVSSAPRKAEPVIPASAISSDGDNDDLQALFDSVAAKAEATHDVHGLIDGVASQLPSSSEPWSQQEAVFNRIGHMARMTALLIDAAARTFAAVRI